MFLTRLVPRDILERAYSPAKLETKRVYILIFLQREFSILFSYYLFIPFGISPNAITVISMALGIAGAAYFALGEFLIGVLLLILWGILDCSDGEVARLTERSSKLGQVLEGLNSNIQYAIWLPALASGLFQMGALEIEWVLGALLAMSLFNITRGFLGAYPTSVLGEPTTSLKKFLACQFKNMRDTRQEHTLGRLVFYSWRYVIAQHCLFELSVLACALFYPAGLIFIAMFYVGAYSVVALGVLFALIVASLVR